MRPISRLSSALGDEPRLRVIAQSPLPLGHLGDSAGSRAARDHKDSEQGDGIIAEEVRASAFSPETGHESGDVRSVAETIGSRLGVDEIRAELLPQDKVERVKKLTAAGRTVVMVGDGVNDAPALVEARVGVAMGSGTDVARECASMVLVGDDLLKLVDTLRIARRCRRTIYANFSGTIVVDSAGMLLAAFGILTPILAALVHVGSELAFILNTARLLTRRRVRPN